MAGQVKQQKSV